MSKFNIRVYGIWINEANEILLSDERIGDFKFTKFPGGGLEYGEGLCDCLIREWNEELNVDIEVLDHIYTTDFFQRSAFNDSQVISVYYLVRPCKEPDCQYKTVAFDFDLLDEEECVFRWKKVSDISEEDVTLPIDKKVVRILISRTHGNDAGPLS